MNHYETNTDGSLVNTSPLFASVWLALYYVLRKNLLERRPPVLPDDDYPGRMKNK